MKRKRKGIALAAAFCLFFTASPGVYAAADQSQGLERAILSVKEVVEIPESFTEFEYTSNETEQNGARWDLYWHDEAYSSSIYAGVDEENQLISFTSYSGSQEGGPLASVSREKARESALAFLQKAMPEAAGQMQEDEGQEASYGNTFDFSYTFYKNGVPAAFKTAQVGVNKYTGQVTRFSQESAGMESLSYPPLEGAITREEGKKAYLDQFGLKLQYNLVQDYESRRIQVTPAYVLSADQSHGIDAMTGEKAALYKEEYRIGSTAENGVQDQAASGGGAADKGFSEAELRELQQTENLMSQEAALEAVSSQVPGSGSWRGPENATLTRDAFDGDLYYWDFYVSGKGNARVNALTGELIFFYRDLQDEAAEKDISQKAALEQAKAFLEEICPQKLSQSVFEENVNDGPVQGDVYDFVWNRQEQGIEVSGNSLRVSYDKTRGEIISYSQSWNEGLTFPSLEGAMTAQAAFDIASEQAGYTLMYLLSSQESPVAVYSFEKRDTVYLDPFTGKRINRDGTPYHQEGLPSYGDIQGRWYEATVKTLLENGYYLPGEDFKGGEPITQEDFLRFLFSPYPSYEGDSQSFYEMLMDRQMIKEGEIDPEAVVLRQDGAKFVIRALGLEQAATIPEIYRNPFRDQIDKEYLGYAALCGGLDIFSGDTKGNFNGKGQLTRGEAAAVVYQYLKVQ